jgi:hypothetical protein
VDSGNPFIKHQSDKLSSIASISVFDSERSRYLAIPCRGISWLEKEEVADAFDLGEEDIIDNSSSSQFSSDADLFVPRIEIINEHSIYFRLNSQS